MYKRNSYLHDICYTHSNQDVMLNLRNLDLSDLLDVLVDQTAWHTQLITSGASATELRNSRLLLIEIQEEIEWRKTAVNMPVLSYSSASSKN